VNVRAVEHRMCNRAGQVFAVWGVGEIHSLDGLAIVIKDLIDDGGELIASDRRLGASLVVVHIRGG